MVDFKSKGPPHQDKMEARYHLMRVRPASFYDQMPNATMEMSSNSEGDTAETYLAPLSLMAIDPKSCVYGPDTYVPSMYEGKWIIFDISKQNELNIENIDFDDATKQKILYIVFFFFFFWYITHGHLF